MHMQILLLSYRVPCRRVQSTARKQQGCDERDCSRHGGPNQSAAAAATMHNIFPLFCFSLLFILLQHKALPFAQHLLLCVVPNENGATYMDIQ